MQPAVVRPNADPLIGERIVLAVIATGQERLRTALRGVAASPQLRAAIARIVVVDAGATPSATVVREAVRLPADLLRVVRQPGSAPEVVARVVAEAVDEQRAGAVLVIEDVALADPWALLDAIGRRAPGADVVGLRDAAAEGVGPAGWWGAVISFDAIRAVGATLPEAGAVALADLVLRAEAAGFRSTVVVAPGPVPVVAEADRLRLALLHEPVRARTRLLLAGAAEDLRLLLVLRPGAVAARRDARRALGAASRVALWSAWPALRRRARSGALDRASADEWALRFLDAEMNPGWPLAERGSSDGRPPALRLPAWPTTKRGRSAA